jgi:hypothetical protein
VDAPDPNRKTWEHEDTARQSAPDIHTQYEEILGSVWDSEANWTFDDRLDLAVARSA